MTDYLNTPYQYVYIDDETGKVKEQGTHTLADVLNGRSLDDVIAKHSSDCPCSTCKTE